MRSSRPMSQVNKCAEQPAALSIVLHHRASAAIFDEQKLGSTPATRAEMPALVLGECLSGELREGLAACHRTVLHR